MSNVELILRMLIALVITAIGSYIVGRLHERRKWQKLCFRWHSLLSRNEHNNV